MNIIATNPSTAINKTTRDHASPTNEAAISENLWVDTLDVEVVSTDPSAPIDRKWGIRLDASGIVTLVLGTREYGRGLYTAYFAGLMAARLGLSFERVRVYYGATLPAVLQTPQPSGIELHESDPAPVAKAVAATIEEMCARVIEKGRLAFAAKVDVDATDVGFDQLTGRFFVLDRDRCSSILEIARDRRRASATHVARSKSLRVARRKIARTELAGAEPKLS